MPQRPQEKFKVSIFPDFSQRKELDKAATSAASLRRWILTELTRQYNQISLFQSKEEMIKSISERGMDGGLMPLTIRRVIHDTYEHFLAMTKEARGKELEFRSRRSNQFLEVPKEDVVFGMTERVVRIPYIGVVKYKINHKILSNRNPTENVAWLLQNIQRIFIGNEASRYFILIDCSDEEVGIEQVKIRKRQRKLPGLLA